MVQPVDSGRTESTTNGFPKTCGWASPHADFRFRVIMWAPCLAGPRSVPPTRPRAERATFVSRKMSTVLRIVNYVHGRFLWPGGLGVA